MADRNQLAELRINNAYAALNDANAKLSLTLWELEASGCCKRETARMAHQRTLEATDKINESMRLLDRLVSGTNGDTDD